MGELQMITHSKHQRNLLIYKICFPLVRFSYKHRMAHLERTKLHTPARP